MPQHLAVDAHGLIESRVAGRILVRIVGLDIEVEEHFLFSLGLIEVEFRTVGVGEHLHILECGRVSAHSAVVFKEDVGPSVPRVHLASVAPSATAVGDKKLGVVLRIEVSLGESRTVGVVTVGRSFCQ